MTVERVLGELRAFAESHAALKGGYGRTDDILTFIDWLRALERTEPVQLQPLRIVRITGPILQEEVDDVYGGVVPDGRWVYP